MYPTLHIGRSGITVPLSREFNNVFFQYIYTSTLQTFFKNNLKRRQPSCMFVLNIG